MNVTDHTSMPSGAGIMEPATNSLAPADPTPDHGGVGDSFRGLSFAQVLQGSGAPSLTPRLLQQPPPLTALPGSALQQGRPLISFKNESFPRNRSSTSPSPILAQANVQTQNQATGQPDSPATSTLGSASGSTLEAGAAGPNQSVVSSPDAPPPDAPAQAGNSRSLGPEATRAAATPGTGVEAAASAMDSLDKAVAGKKASSVNRERHEKKDTSTPAAVGVAASATMGVASTTPAAAALAAPESTSASLNRSSDLSGAASDSTRTGAHATVAVLSVAKGAAPGQAPPGGFAANEVAASQSGGAKTGAALADLRSGSPAQAPGSPAQADAPAGSKDSARSEAAGSQTQGSPPAKRLDSAAGPINLSGSAGGPSGSQASSPGSMTSSPGSQTASAGLPSASSVSPTASSGASSGLSGSPSGASSLPASPSGGQGIESSSASTLGAVAGFPSNGAGATSHPGSFPSGAFPAGAAFGVLDAASGAAQTGRADGAGGSTLGHQLLLANARQLEVGVADPAHGWLRIRAEMGANGLVHASLTAAAPAREYDLRAALPGMAAYLSQEHVAAGGLTLGKSADGSLTSGGAGAGPGTPHPGGARDGGQAGQPQGGQAQAGMAWREGAQQQAALQSDQRRSDSSRAFPSSTTRRPAGGLGGGVAGITVEAGFSVRV